MSFIPVTRGAEPYFMTALMEYLEERKAIHTIMDMSRDLVSDFSNVKVEFRDLDGLGWDHHPPGIEEQLQIVAKIPYILITPAGPPSPALDLQPASHSVVSSTSQVF
ncbi:hypothetical protein L218DRAFT_1006891 [Marasmius fiardii PR-910]|nr:hypothetical protein L218DRAFT_1006891 [Marasmius fiardii PR-910]